MTEIIYIPISRKLYDDLIRFSDGRLDPAEIAEHQLQSWVERDLEFGGSEHWGTRFKDAAMEYAPHLIERIKQEEHQAAVGLDEERRPLVWKELTIPAGSEVRMTYNGKQHYAVIKGGRIVDNDGAFTPSEWASKVAAGTSRNAWRDIWFRVPLSKNWVPAQTLRLTRPN